MQMYTQCTADQSHHNKTSGLPPPKERHFSKPVRVLRPPPFRALDAARSTMDFYPAFSKRELADGHGLDMLVSCILMMNMLNGWYAGTEGGSLKARTGLEKCLSFGGEGSRGFIVM